MKKIEADIKYYNANNRQTLTGDCVLRSISLALDIPYSKVKKEIGVGEFYNRPVFYQPYIAERLGYGKVSSKEASALWTKVTEAITLDEFCHQHSTGTYLIATGNKTGSPNHLVCIIDGDVYDSWNSLDEYVKRYLQIPEDKTSRVSDDLDIEVLRDYVLQACTETLDKYITKFKLDQYGLYHKPFHVSENRSSSYALDCYVLLKADDVISDSNHTYQQSLEFPIVFTPKMSQEDALAYAKKTIPTRIYDRLYYVRRDLPGLVEGMELRERIAKSNPNYKQKDVWMSSTDYRFFKTLPAKIRPLITFIDVTKASFGGWGDYYVKMYPLPDDPNPDKSPISFTAVDADTLRYEIDFYLDTFVRPDLYSDYEAEERELESIDFKDRAENGW